MNIALDFGPYLKSDPSVRMRLRVPPLSDDALYQVCQRNDGWHIEREPNEELTIRPVMGTVCGLQVSALKTQLADWCERSGLGVVPERCAGMLLRNGAMRCPSAACVSANRWNTLHLGEYRGFLPFCADFVAEVLSPFDDHGELLDKMLEYRENGARLAWLIDPATRTVDVFRPREPVRSHADLTHLTEPPDSAILPGFVLDLRRVWNAARETASHPTLAV
jgi:Uma2 family endonuclease